MIFCVFPLEPNTFCTFSFMTDSKTFTVAFFCKTGSSGKQELMHCMFTVLQGPRLVRNLFGTCSGFVRVLFVFMLFGSFCSWTWSELVRNLFGSCSGFVRVWCGSSAGCFFFRSSLHEFPNEPFLSTRRHFRQFQPRSFLFLFCNSSFSIFLLDFRLKASGVKDFQILRTKHLQGCKSAGISLLCAVSLK